jgi:hypothetical protein
VARYIQLMIALQHQGALQDGWMLMPRLHILERNFNAAVRSDAEWQQKRQALGFGNYSRQQAQALNNNDWLHIAISVAAQRNVSSFLQAWGLKASATAMQQVDALALETLQPRFYAVENRDYCDSFNKRSSLIEPGMAWPTN